MKASTSNFPPNTHFLPLPPQVDDRFGLCQTCAANAFDIAHSVHYSTGQCTLEEHEIVGRNPLPVWRGRGGCLHVLRRGSSRPQRRAGPRRLILQIIATQLPPVLSTAPRLLKTSRNPRNPRGPHLRRCPRRSSRESLSLPSRIRSPRTYPTRTTRRYTRGTMSSPCLGGKRWLPVLLFF